jgi:hypothetical protein
MRKTSIKNHNPSERRDCESPFAAHVIAEVREYRIVAVQCKYTPKDLAEKDPRSRWAFHVERRGWNNLGEAVWVQVDNQTDSEQCLLSALFIASGFSPPESGEWVDFGRIRNLPIW